MKDEGQDEERSAHLFIGVIALVHTEFVLNRKVPEIIIDCRDDFLRNTGSAQESFGFEYASRALNLSLLFAYKFTANSQLAQE